MDSLSETQIPDNNEQSRSTEIGSLSEWDSEVYQIRPKLEEKFKPSNAREVIQNVLSDHLSTKEFNFEEAPKWAKDIADIIRDKIKKLQFKRYKYIVNVVLGTKNGSGVKMGTRCIWDAEADAYAHDSFTNETLFCVATVYAVYHY